MHTYANQISFDSIGIGDSSWLNNIIEDVKKHLALNAPTHEYPRLFTALYQLRDIFLFGLVLL